MLTAAHGNNWLEFTQKAVKEALKMMKMIILAPETYQLLSPGRNWNISPGNKYIIAMLLAMGNNRKHN